MFDDTGIGLYPCGTDYDVLYVLDSVFAQNDDAIGGTWLNEINDVHVENCLFVDNEYCVRLEYGYSDRIGSEHAIVHNTFVGNFAAIERGRSDVYNEATVTIENNLFHSGDYSYIFYNGGENATFTNNLIGYDGTDAMAFYGDEITDSQDNVYDDPMLVDFSDDGDWTNDDLRLLAGSPAIDIGTTGSASVQGADFDGVTRPLDGDWDGTALPDAGAYEYDPDEDGDGYAIEDVGGTDCDDTDASVNPAATETWYDGVDSDCDGADDYDQDSDGYQHSGYGGLDCDDTDASVHPGTVDAWYDGVDQDCDGASDYDQDGDGHDSDAHSGDDCDDLDAAVNPDAVDAWYDGVDSDCDGANDYDQDADGYLASTYGGADCDDTDASINPDATEIWYDGVDQDCDGSSDDDQDGDGYDVADDCDDTDASTHPDAIDAWYDGVDSDGDGDGYDSASHGGDDCDDGDATVYPGAPDEPYDGVIHDCDASDEYDADGDGHLSSDWGGDDCDDAASDVFPGATETWYDGVDQDCDGNDADQDGDGWDLDTDCDDGDAAIWPGAPGWTEDCEPASEDTGIDGEPGCSGCASPARSQAPWLPLAFLGLALGFRRRGRPI